MTKALLTSKYPGLQLPSNQLLQVMEDLRSAPCYSRRETSFRKTKWTEDGKDLESTPHDPAADDGDANGPAAPEMDALNYNLPTRPPRRVTTRLIRPCFLTHANETGDSTPRVKIVSGLMPSPDIVTPYLR